VVAHRYTRDSLTYLLECYCVPQIWPLHFFLIKVDKIVCWLSVKWISDHFNMFAIYYLSQIHHSHWYCILIHCSLLSIIGVIMQSWFTPPNNIPLLYTCYGVLHKKHAIITPRSLNKSVHCRKTALQAMRSHMQKVTRRLLHTYANTTSPPLPRSLPRSTIRKSN